MFEKLKRDIDAVRERDPAARNSFEVLMTSSGLHAILLHRPANWLYKHDHYLSARVVSQLARFATGIEIHPGAKIGAGVLIDHGMGVVIGETAEVGDGCTIYQGVTLGGTGRDKGKRHPTLGKNVTVGCGAKILGPFKVGDGAKVAANAVLLESIPANATAVGVPARVAHVGGNKVATLDHVHLPDPVAQELCRLQSSVDKLERRVVEIEKTGAAKDEKPVKAPAAKSTRGVKGAKPAAAKADKNVKTAAAAKGESAAKTKVPRPPAGKAKSADAKAIAAQTDADSGKAQPADAKAIAAQTDADSGKAQSADVETIAAQTDADSGKAQSADVETIAAQMEKDLGIIAAQTEADSVDAKASAPAGRRAARGNQSHHPVPATADLMLEREISAGAESGARQTADEPPAAELPAAVEMEHPVPAAFVQK